MVFSGPQAIGTYSQAVRVGDTVYLSGQIPLDPATGELVQGDITDQRLDGIVNAANAVIDNNVERKPKHLWTDSGGGDRIVRYHAEDEGDEAMWVAGTAQQLHDDDAMNWREMAVLYRTNAQGRVIEEAFMRLGVPYKVVGGTRFYDRREIKDAMAYLRAVINPLDEVSVKRVINVPKRGVGEASIARLDEYAREMGVPFVDAMRHAEDAGVSGPARRGLAKFVEFLDRTLCLPTGPLNPRHRQSAGR